ncbi:MAG TPA: hypothetical protein HA362_04910 [Nanoarchaeota archaeon]|nr:hypothetical protein [Nanoarchaeota archaeon]
MNLEEFTEKYKEIYLREAVQLSIANADFREYAFNLFNNNPTLVKKLYLVYKSKGLSDARLEDGIRAIALYSLMHFEHKSVYGRFPLATYCDADMRRDVAAFVFSEGTGSRLSLMGIGIEKAMFEIPEGDNFSPLVHLACLDLGYSGIKTVLTVSETTRDYYTAIFGKNPSFVFTDEPGRNKMEAFRESIKVLEQMPTLIFRTCSDTMRDTEFLKRGIQQHLSLPNPEEHITVLARVLDMNKGQGMSAVSVRVEGDTAINFTKSPAILEGDHLLVYKVGSLIGKKIAERLMASNEGSYNTFCNRLSTEKPGSVSLITTSLSLNRGLDDVFDLQDYILETYRTQKSYEVVNSIYRRI